MTLRQPDLSDASSIAAISIEVWVGTYLKQGVNGFFADYALREFSAGKAARLISDPAQFIRVSQNEQGIDGFIRVAAKSTELVSEGPQMEIATLYVQPRHQGKGIGKRLLGAALDHCRAQKAQTVWLATNALNDPAIAFYLAQGFVKVGETHFRIADQGYLNNVYALQLG